jgi:hypothetical protein
MPRHQQLARGPLTLAQLHGAFARSNEQWVDALDPTLPAEPAVFATPTTDTPRLPHKLILLGLSVSAGALGSGYACAAFWL